MNYIESLNVIQLILSSINSKVFSYAPTIVILYSKITCLILLAILALMTKLQFVDRPISCTYDENFHYLESFNTYCWYDGLYIRRDSSERLYAIRQGEQIFKIKYLSWVYWFLLLKIFLYYTPVIIWEYCEKKFQNALIYKKFCLLYLCAVGRKIYWTSVKCQCLCLIIILTMAVGTNIFLSGYFIDLGIRWIHEYLQADLMSENSEGGLAHIFPTVSKCKFNTVGMSGTIVVKDNTCLILINSFNEKVFVFIWFWYIFLFIMVTFMISYNLLLLFPSFRKISISFYISSKYPLMKVFADYSIGNYYILTTLLSSFTPQQLYSSIEEYYKDQAVEFQWFDEINNKSENTTKGWWHKIFHMNIVDQHYDTTKFKKVTKRLPHFQNDVMDEKINSIQIDMEGPVDDVNNEDEKLFSTKL